jgi:hypothetical protein
VRHLTDLDGLADPGSQLEREHEDRRGGAACLTHGDVPPEGPGHAEDPAQDATSSVRHGRDPSASRRAAEAVQNL